MSLPDGGNRGSEGPVGPAGAGRGRGGRGEGQDIEASGQDVGHRELSRPDDQLFPWGQRPSPRPSGHPKSHGFPFPVYVPSGGKTAVSREAEGADALGVSAPPHLEARTPDVRIQGLEMPELARAPLGGRGSEPGTRSSACSFVGLCVSVHVCTRGCMCMYARVWAECVGVHTCVCVRAGVPVNTCYRERV